MKKKPDKFKSFLTRTNDWINFVIFIHNPSFITCNKRGIHRTL